jgi:hypothetical protein
MRKAFVLAVVLCLVAGIALAQYGKSPQEKPATSAGPKPDFEITATYIEACSCDMFCPCYFNTRSTLHGSEQYCRANLVFKVDKGHYKEVKLDGAKVWVATDLGSDWSTGKNSWVVVNYDPGVTPAQKAALNDIVGQLYPFKWGKMDVDTAAFTWNVDTTKGVAHAKMNSGKGEVILERVKGDNFNQEVVNHNLKYWMAQSNTGFRMWKSKHEAFEGQGHKFSYDGTNGFLVTIHFSGQAKAPAAD